MLNLHRPEPLLLLKNLRLDVISARPVRILHGVSLAVQRAAATGVVGESGCGKSVTWLAALRLLPPHIAIDGTIEINGVDVTALDDRSLARIRGGTIAMIFQDPISALNPIQTVGRQIGEALVLHRGLTWTQARHEARRLLDDVRVANAAERLHAYPHELSGGMCQRIMIAMALAGEPDLLVADEPTTALDATVQSEVLDLLREIRRERHMALVLISHDLGVVSSMCDELVVMYCGAIVEQGPTDRLLSAPAHPYTRGLVQAATMRDGATARVDPIPGSVPSPAQLPPGCAFAPRCALADAQCAVAPPMLEPLASDHLVACYALDRPSAVPGHRSSATAKA